ncbi:MAG: hypothetical protein KKF65_00325, partial [Nanoarchaeota archaeon]|nr:hypothetical protein [Nanoarchaeota archaeon]
MKAETRRKIILATIIILAAASLYQTAFTGFVVKEDIIKITENLELELNHTEKIELLLKEKPKSLTINGKIIGEGQVKIYLEHGNRKLLVYDNKYQQEGLTDITGRVTANITIENTTQNITTEIIIIENITIVENVTSKVNITENITINTTPELNITTNLSENITESEILNISKTNITESEILNIS